MGYHTDFEGSFSLDKPLSTAHRRYLKTFSGTRRMKRNASVTATMPDPLRKAVELSIGDDGGYFVGVPENDEDGNGSVPDYGQTKTSDVIDYNSPPQGQPGLWCQWVPSEDGTSIEWDEGEKFYHYVQWITYLIDHFLKPWGYVLKGEVRWHGEEIGDVGKIIVDQNEVQIKTIVYE